MRIFRTFLLVSPSQLEAHPCVSGLLPGSEADLKTLTVAAELLGPEKAKVWSHVKHMEVHFIWLCAQTHAHTEPYGSILAHRIHDGHCVWLFMDRAPDDIIILMTEGQFDTFWLLQKIMISLYIPLYIINATPKYWVIPGNKTRLCLNYNPLQTPESMLEHWMVFSTNQWLISSKCGFHGCRGRFHGSVSAPHSRTQSRCC